LNLLKKTIKMFEKHDVMFYFNKSLKLWQVMLYDHIIYIEPKKFDELDEKSFSLLVANSIMEQVQAGNLNGFVTLH